MNVIEGLIVEYSWQQVVSQLKWYLVEFISEGMIMESRVYALKDKFYVYILL